METKTKENIFIFYFITKQIKSFFKEANKFFKLSKRRTTIMCGLRKFRKVRKSQVKQFKLRCVVMGILNKYKRRTLTNNDHICT